MNSVTAPVVAEVCGRFVGGLGEATGAEEKDVGHADLLLGCVFTVILTGASTFPTIICSTTSQAVGSDSVNQFKIHSEFLSTHMSGNLAGFMYLET